MNKPTAKYKKESLILNLLFFIRTRTKRDLCNLILLSCDPAYGDSHSDLTICSVVQTMKIFNRTSFKMQRRGMASELDLYRIKA